jgi:hypothetical protein
MIDFLQGVFFISEVNARGGGGGSGGGGGGGGDGWVGLIILIIVTIYAAYKRRQKIKKAKAVMEIAESKDSAWDDQSINQRVSDVFYSFQKDWSNFDIEAMRAYLTEEYYKRMVLEMSVLKNLGRKNSVNEPKVKSIAILEANDAEDNSQDNFVAEVKAVANDRLIDTFTGQQIFEDNRTFTEYWKFQRINNEWRLDLIRQSTEAGEFVESSIKNFAQEIKGYFDPDFGWLMMPNKGAIFRKTNFKVSDINNHVIGYFRDKIVEFYTYIPNPNNNNYQPKNYIVAQAILPIMHYDILVRKKRWLFNITPRGMRRLETESNDFNKKFCLWADLRELSASFELLTPNFMEKIYALPFELNIEVVGNVLYLYARSRKNLNYHKMLEILSWAFDEMKM